MCLGALVHLLTLDFLVIVVTFKLERKLGTQMCCDVEQSVYLAFSKGTVECIPEKINANL